MSRKTIWKRNFALHNNNDTNNINKNNIVTAAARPGINAKKDEYKIHGENENEEWETMRKKMIYAGYTGRICDTYCRRWKILSRSATVANAKMQLFIRLTKQGPLLTQTQTGQQFT